jgi:hypothetical protein
MVDDAEVLQDARDSLTVRFALRSITHMMAVPQGFTLSIAGTLTITIGQRGYPGPIAIWLFVVGAGAGLGALTLLSGAHRKPADRPRHITRPSGVNLSPVLVVPLAAAAAWWIPDVAIAMTIAGSAAAVLYVWLTAAMMIALHSWGHRQGRGGRGHRDRSR